MEDPSDAADARWATESLVRCCVESALRCPVESSADAELPPPGLTGACCEGPFLSFLVAFCRASTDFRKDDREELPDDLLELLPRLNKDRLPVVL